MKFVPNNFFQKNDCIAFKVIPQEKKKKRTIFMIARQIQILCTVHHISKEYPQTHFAVRLSLLSKVKLHGLEIRGFKLPAALLWKKQNQLFFSIIIQL